MNTQFSANAWSEFQYWLNQDQEIAKKILALTRDIHRTPFRGIGKPELLKGELQGYWSRRITSEHRLVYQIKGNPEEVQVCIIIQCKYHY
ncbi:MAG: Txe/YoeB family addiction module toxin [Lewinellaceae bacterium]|nr:Txe/YoeB family addiction module toxin [Lewinellaceae bacterium]